jgi:hypothetical protein
LWPAAIDSCRLRTVKRLLLNDRALMRKCDWLISQEQFHLLGLL